MSSFSDVSEWSDEDKLTCVLSPSQSQGDLAVAAPATANGGRTGGGRTPRTRTSTRGGIHQRSKRLANFRPPSLKNEHERPFRRRDVPVLPARYTRHCGGECGPGQVAVYDVHRQTVGGAAHKVEAVRAAHVDPRAGTAGELFAGLRPAPPTNKSKKIPQSSEGMRKTRAAPSPMLVVATVYHRPGRGFPLLPQRRVVAPTAEAAADIAVSAAPTAEGTGHAAVAVYGRLTDAEKDEVEPNKKKRAGPHRPAQDPTLRRVQPSLTTMARTGRAASAEPKRRVFNL